MGQKLTMDTTPVVSLTTSRESVDCVPIWRWTKEEKGLGKSVVLVTAGRKKMNLQCYVVLLNSRERVGGYCSKI